MRSPSGKQKRQKRRERLAEQREQFIRDNPTPYEGFADIAVVNRSLVQSAMKRASMTTMPTWVKDKNRSPSPLTLDDLAVAYFAVERVGQYGITYGQLDRCFRTTTNRSCHRAKVTAVLAALVSLGMIVKVGNYSVGRKGNQYKIVREPFVMDDFIKSLHS